MIYVEKEAIENAKAAYDAAMVAVDEAIKNGTPADVRFGIGHAREVGGAYRALLRAGYNL